MSAAAPAACFICGNPLRRVLRTRGYWVRKCDHCQYRAAEYAPPADHTASLYADAYFFGGGAGYPDYLQEARLLYSYGEYYSQLVSQYAAPGRVLDVGAAAGYILKAFVDRGWEGQGLEPNLGMAEYARTTIGLDVSHGVVESFSSPHRFDLVCLIQVAAHFFDPVAAFRSIAQLTAPGGLWLVETWNPASRIARLFGRYWHEYSPPTALHYYTPEALTRLAATYGMTVVARGRPRKRLTLDHAKSLLVHLLPRWRIIGRIADLIPGGLTIPYYGDDVYWILFRKSAGLPD